jgi:hypothetical protein
MLSLTLQTMMATTIQVSKKMSMTSERTCGRGVRSVSEDVGMRKTSIVQRKMVMKKKRMMMTTMTTKMCRTMRMWTAIRIQTESLRGRGFHIIVLLYRNLDYYIEHFSIWLRIALTWRYDMLRYSMVPYPMIDFCFTVYKLPDDCFC